MNEELVEQAWEIIESAMMHHTKWWLLSDTEHEKFKAEYLDKMTTLLSTPNRSRG